MTQIVPTDFTLHDDCTNTIAANATDAEVRLAALEAASLTLVAGTDAAVTMLPKRHYELNATILTSDRIYKLPAGAVGDRIRVSLLLGSSIHPTLYELILQGDTGITINGGSAATEWSRLFIAREYVEFRATSTTNWDVWDDGRIPQDSEMRTTINYIGALADGAYTAFPFNSSYTDRGTLINPAITTFTVRRAGVYQVEVLLLITNQAAALTANAAQINVNSTRFFLAQLDATPVFAYTAINGIRTFNLSAGDVLYVEFYHNNGGVTTAAQNSRFRIRELIP